ncbi:sugar ABC transporter permease [Paenibacillus sp. MY03]|jgi:putative aldouronate transport system permease protein|uniref:carbohydrate ABC transporter permease n=1 Tax=Paenibacillaceae TaxID=186822 RepID=UPI000B3C3E09|nr:MULTISPECIES: carbohydrate ABC transporter permease [Paenibacillaceae]OUS75636.1 sugar ABC transporter permease [Paenibacillus sp. MY03]QTH40789.1 carbohydrate ABC transporter permease [Cohnella sp. LGH]
MFKRSLADIWFDRVNMLLILTGLAIIVYPLYFVVLASVTDPGAVQMTLFWPEKFSLEGYKKILDSDNLWVGYKNSFVYAILGTIINLCLTLPAAYALSRKDMKGRSTIMLVITFTMFFSGGLIPTYLTVKELGLLDSVWAMVIPNAVGAWNLIIARTFFQSTIPDELLEAAKIDGCSDAKFFWKMVLPLSQALIAIMVLFYGVAHWNSYFNALIYLRDQELYPLQLVLRSILIENQISNDMMTDLSSMGDRLRAAELIKYGMIIIAALPLLILYPFLQNYFVKGVMIGSIKG